MGPSSKAVTRLCGCLAGVLLSAATTVAAPATGASDWFAADPAGAEMLVPEQQGGGASLIYTTLAGIAGMAALVGLLWRSQRKYRNVATRLQAAEERLADVQTIASVGSWTRDFASGETYWSPEARSLLMLDEHSDPPHYEAMIHPGDLAQVTEVIARAYSRGGAYRCDHRLVCPGGIQKYVRLAGRVYLDGKGGSAVFEHGTIQDITERKLVEIHLRDSEARLRGVLDSMSLALLVIAQEGALPIRYANPAAQQLLGPLTGSDASGGLQDASHWASAEALEGFLHLLRDPVAQGGAPATSEILMRHADGALFWAEVTVTRYCHEDEAAWLLCVADVTRRRAKVEELERRATTDPATGGLNLHGFREQALREMRRALRYQQPLAICLLSVDQYPVVHEAFGDAAGRKLVEAWLEVIRDVVRTEDCIASLGAAEFALLLVGATLERARQVSERIRQMTEVENFELDRQRIPLTVSAGSTGLGDGADTLDALMERAHQALEAAQKAGGNRVMTLAVSAGEDTRRNA